MSMDHKSFPLSIEIKAEGDARTIEGLGSVFNNVDGGNDIVLPGAFTKSLLSRKPAMLWQHKSDHVIGVWDELRETNEGLFVKGRILETQLGNDAYTLAKAGAITGMSIGYGTKDATMDKKTGIRHLKELSLYEVSLVTFPMNERAGITRIKAAAGDIDDASALLEQAIELCKKSGNDDLLGLIESALDLIDIPANEDQSSVLTPKSIERILREAGMSRSDARCVIAKGFTAIATPREAGQQEQERLVNFINSLKS